MIEQELKPCPFCGHHPHLWGDTSGEYQIECVNGSCPSEPSVWMPEKEDAIAAWNTRTPDPAQIRADAIREVADHLRWLGWSLPARAILALLDTPLSPTAVDNSPAPDAGGKEDV